MINIIKNSYLDKLENLFYETYTNTEIIIFNDVSLKRFINNLKDYHSYYNYENLNLHRKLFNIKYTETSIKNTLYIDEAVYFYIITGYHENITHLVFDFYDHLNQYYNILIKNINIKIIFEIYLEPNLYSINKFIEFIRDLNIHNEILFIGNNFTEIQNNIDYINIKKIYYANYYINTNLENKTFNYLPYITKCSNNNHSDNIVEILTKKFYQDKNLNIKKNLILEYRAFNRRGPNNFLDIKIICQKYCNEKNLELIIWNDEYNQKSLKEQILITYNTEIIIGFGGSFFLFNFINNSSKILILNISFECDDINITYANFYTYLYHYINNNKNIYIHFSTNNTEDIQPLLENSASCNDVLNIDTQIIDLNIINNFLNDNFSNLIDFSYLFKKIDKFKYNTKLNLNQLLSPKIINFKGNLILICSKLYREENFIKKYILYSYLINDEFKIIENSENIINLYNIKEEFITDLNISIYIRDLYFNEDKGKYYLLIDFNTTKDNILESNNFLLETEDFLLFEKIKNYETKNILYKDYNNNLFISKKIDDKYLFEFVINNNCVKPNFGNFINYLDDIQHTLYDIEYDISKKYYIFIFSIINKDNKYKVYKSNTLDFINFFNIIEIDLDFYINKYINKDINKDINNKYLNNNFYITNFFKYYDKKFLILGNNNENIIYREYIKNLEFIENKYSIDNIISNKLIFNNDNFIFNNDNYLFKILKDLDINNNDSILNIHSEKGLELILFNLFPFKKICGIETDQNEIKTCLKNFNLLNINNININNNNYLIYDDYNDYNYIYFNEIYDIDIFEKIIIKINNPSIKIICYNINEEQKILLEKYDYDFLNYKKGYIGRYFIFSHSNTIINYTKNIKFIYNDTTNYLLKKYLNKLNKYFNEEETVIPNIVISNNVLLDSYKINEVYTSYNIDHLILDNNKNLPNPDIFNNFFKKNSNKIIKNDSYHIKNAVFLNSFTSAHNYVTHFILDFSKTINIFYDLLNQNKDFYIILEIIPHGLNINNSYTHKSYFDKYNYNISEFNYDIKNSYIQFFRDIFINNKIIIISDIIEFQNFKNNIFIENLYHIDFKEINNFTWLPLISRLYKDNKDQCFYDKMNNILKYTYENNNNIHFNYYKKKFFILEKRITSSFFQQRNITIEDFAHIECLCQYYCDTNNLQLVIWDSELVNNNTLFQQFNISNNAEIIIGTGGSNWLFNSNITNGKILILGIFSDGESDNMFNMTLLTYYHTLIIKNVNKLVYFKENDSNHKYYNIIYDFLYRIK